MASLLISATRTTDQPFRTDRTLEALLERYSRTGKPIRVDFRRLVDWIPNVDRATHLLHPYPAKLLAQIPHFFLNNELLSRPGDVVLDPFCGSGTVLLEGLMAGRRALGTDANPLARLISQVKTRPLPATELRRAAGRLLDRIPNKADNTASSTLNLRYWYHPHIIAQLNRIRAAIMNTRHEHYRDVFAVCFSNCARRVSLADPRLAVPVRLRADQYAHDHWLAKKTATRLKQLRRINVLKLFEDILWQNVERVISLEEYGSLGGEAMVVGTDARRLPRKVIPRDSVNLVLTSPPYAGAQKYVRASSLNLGWLDLTEGKTLRQLEDENIGREHYPKAALTHRELTGVDAADRMLRDIRATNPLRAHIAATYLNEMRDAIAEAAHVLAPGGHMVLVAANNTVCGREFRTQAYLRTVAEQAGLVTRLRLTDDIRSRGLMTRRNTTAGVIAREWVHLYEKPRVAVTARPSKQRRDPTHD